MNLKEKLFLKAQSARENSYSPYSKFAVGSAIKFKNIDEIYSGCNIENGSFGATICAERVAIYKGISEIKKQSIEAILIITSGDEGDYPCGLCLQTLSEFSNNDTTVYLANPKEIKREFKFNDMMPYRFDFFK